MEPIVDEALSRLGIEADWEIISDAREIVKLGVMNAPALMINGIVKISGKFPTVEEVVQALKESQ